MARVLVTGASGLIGRGAVRALLAAGHEVVTLGRAAGDGPGTRAIACDLLDPAATDRALAEASERLIPSKR